MLPCRLNDGILLEDSDVILPWDAHLDSLGKLGSPKKYEKSDCTQLFWDDQPVLCDLRCQIEATFYRRPVMYDPPANDGNRLRLVFLNFGFDDNKSVREQYADIRTHMSRSLGVTPNDLDLQWPAAEWDLGTVLVVLLIHDRFGEMCNGEIWRKPLPKWRET